MGLRALRLRHTELKGQIAKVAKERADIGAKALAEGRSKLTDEERASFTALGEKLHGLEAELAANAELLQAAEAAEAAEVAYRGDTTDPDVDAGRRAARGTGVQPGRDNTDDDPNRGFKDHREFLGAVMTAGRTGRVDDRLKPLAAAGSDEQGAYSDPHGGFLIPHGVAPGILSIAPEDDPIAALTTKPPMRTPTVSFNARTDKDHSSSVSGGLVVTRRPETVDGSSSRMKFEQVVLTANELFGLAFATERILTDSPESFVAILAAGFRDEYGAKAMDERLNGSGVGEPLGVLHASNGCLITVSKESGQAADTIVKENIDKMVARCWRYGRAVWTASHDTLPQLMGLVQVVGTGGNAVPYLTGTPGGPMMLLNRPLHFTEHAPKLGDKGDLSLNVWSEYLEGEYQPLRTDESIHVRFAAAERCFRFYKRNDGQPWWRTALTPKNGGATLSPCVTLQAR